MKITTKYVRTIEYAFKYRLDAEEKFIELFKKEWLVEPEMTRDPVSGDRIIIINWNIDNIADLISADVEKMIKEAEEHAKASNKDFDTKFEEMQALDREVNDKIDDCKVTYSINNPLDEVAVKGKVSFYCNGDFDWGDEEEDGENYVGPVLTDPTWMDVARCADQMIKTTGDYHHSFLEGISKVKDGKATFLMGS